MRHPLLQDYRRRTGRLVVHRLDAEPAVSHHVTRGDLRVRIHLDANGEPVPARIRPAPAEHLLGRGRLDVRPIQQDSPGVGRFRQGLLEHEKRLHDARLAGTVGPRKDRQRPYLQGLWSRDGLVPRDLKAGDGRRLSRLCRSPLARVGHCAPPNSASAAHAPRSRPPAASAAGSESGTLNLLLPRRGPGRLPRGTRACARARSEDGGRAGGCGPGSGAPTG